MTETVKSWSEQWLEEYDSVRCSRSTVQAHGYLIRNHIAPRLGEVELNALTEQDVLAFLAALPLGEAGRRNVSAVLRRCLQQAVTDGLLEYNPVSVGLYHCPDSVNANILTEREMQDYLAEADKQKRLAIFRLLLCTGVKVGELVQIRRENLEPEKNMLTVTGQRFRRIPLAKETTELLLQEHARHRSSELLFLHPGSQKPYTRSEIYCYHRKIVKACDLDGIRLCDLRHSCAVHALKNGIRPEELAAVLGHSDAQDILRTYKACLPRRI